MEFDINSPKFNDNRNYSYSSEVEKRDEYSIFIELIKPNSKVIDLGCGNGSLLSLLIEEKNITATGVEISESGVAVCKNKGLNVIKGRIDEPLNYDDNSFDYAICNVTIQMVMFPEILLKEMKRISKFQIISFPNFAFYKNRIDLLMNGRMPKPMMFDYKWYSTGHIHQLSINDFYELLNDIGGFRIVEIYLGKSNNPIKNFLLQKFPNLFQILTVFLLEKNR